MNRLEQEMSRILTDLRENHHVIGVKAEFEAEGTRMDEAMRLKEVVSRAGLDLTIKVGGCEALKDMYDAKTIGVTRIVGPMIETPYAMSKFVHCAQTVFPKDQGYNVDFLINVETITAVEKLDEMLAHPASKQIKGIVLGRTDMTGSLGMTKDDINSERIFKIAEEVLSKCHARGMECVIGGGVSGDSLPFFRRLPAGSLHKYETRKVLFQCPGTLDENAAKGILKAVGFEVMWLKNKRDFYGCIKEEDTKRIENLERMYKKLIVDAGGSTGDNI